MNQTEVNHEQIAEWRKVRGHGMVSAVGEYTPSEFWLLLDSFERLERGLAKANADKAGLIKALDETITMLEMRIEIDSDKDFETANDQIAALLKFSGGTRSAWAETAPRVILSARTALSQVQA